MLTVWLCWYYLCKYRQSPNMIPARPLSNPGHEARSLPESWEINCATSQTQQGVVPMSQRSLSEITSTPREETTEILCSYKLFCLSCQCLLALLSGHLFFYYRPDTFSQEIKICQNLLFVQMGLKRRKKTLSKRYSLHDWFCQTPSISLWNFN